MKRDDRPDETMDLGIVTLRSRGAGPALESMLPDTMMDLGTMGADASTPFLGHNHHFGPRSDVPLRLFGHNLLTQIPEAPSPPPSRSQPGTDFVSQQQANRMADLIDSVAQLQSEVRALKFASPTLPTPATGTQPVQHRSATFTTTEVPKFRGATSWDQYRQVFDAIVRSNGWDDDTVALQLLSHLEGDMLNVTLLVPEA